jgi:hypothetical protein
MQKKTKNRQKKCKTEPKIAEKNAKQNRGLFLGPSLRNDVLLKFQ